MVTVESPESRAVSPQTPSVIGAKPPPTPLPTLASLAGGGDEEHTDRLLRSLEEKMNCLHPHVELRLP
jgi:hypothetical protein